MLSAERHELILRLLRRERFATIADISRAASSSPATIRRDLERLSQEGLVQRVRGGAEIVTPRDSAEPPLEYRKGVNMERKRVIAKAAAKMCQEGETIMIDGGSTTFPMAEFLRERELKIITNSFAIAAALVPRSRSTVILAGGVVRMDSQLILDPFGEDLFSNYTASRVFMGAFGIDETGATNNDSLLIKTERAMIERARELVVLADSSKFDRRGSLFLCDLEKITVIITDDGISDSHRAMITSRGVRLVVA
jgi:DeoR family ulaG and ulaABCDEF operon transcriptional repressor